MYALRIIWLDDLKLTSEWHEEMHLEFVWPWWRMSIQSCDT